MEVQVVYLDQNVASFLAKPNPEPVWREIREALTEGFQNRKLICPLPFEGVIETTPRPLEHRKAMQSLFWQLSEGVAFKQFTEMSNELTLGLVRPAPDWSPWLIWKPLWAEMEDAAQKVKTDWWTAKKRMTERMNNFVESPNLKTMSEKELFHAVAVQRSGWIYNDLDSLLAGQVDESSLKCPWLIEFLIAEKLSPSEIETLKRAVQYHGWATIPIHALDMLLAVKWEFDSLRGGAAAYAPNDEIDRKRAAMALNYSDLFITEKDLTNLCRKAKVSNVSTTLVLSVRETEKILEAVEGINRN